MRGAPLTVERATFVNESLLDVLQQSKLDLQREQELSAASAVETRAARRELADSNEKLRRERKENDRLEQRCAETDAEMERKAAMRRVQFERLQQKLSDSAEERRLREAALEAERASKAQAMREADRLRRKLAAQIEHNDEITRELNQKRWQKATETVVDAVKKRRAEREVEALEVDLSTLRATLATERRRHASAEAALRMGVDGAQDGETLSVELGLLAADADDVDEFAALFAHEEESAAKATEATELERAMKALELQLAKPIVTSEFVGRLVRSVLGAQSPPRTPVARTKTRSVDFKGTRR